MDDETKRPEEMYPAVDTAYDFIMPSFQLLVSRVEATVTRLQAVMTFAVTITLGFPILGKAMNDKAVFWSAAFAAAVVCFIILMIVGIFARDMGDVMLINPRKLYEGSLHLTLWEFKKDALFYAGQCFDHNKALINRKADLGRVMSALLAAEVVAFLIWIARG